MSAIFSRFRRDLREDDYEDQPLTVSEVPNFEEKKKIVSELDRLMTSSQCPSMTDTSDRHMPPQDGAGVRRMPSHTVSRAPPSPSDAYTPVAPLTIDGGESANGTAATLEATSSQASSRQPQRPPPITGASTMSRRASRAPGSSDAMALVSHPCSN